MTAVLFLFMTYKMVNVYLEKMNHGTKSDDCYKLSRTEQVLKCLSLTLGNIPSLRPMAIKPPDKQLRTAEPNHLELFNLNNRRPHTM